MVSAVRDAGPDVAARPGRGRVRPGVLLALAAFVILWFGFLGLRGLYFPDEGRYAEIPREMLASGDFVTPRLNGFPYFEKPPLQYWMTAIVFAVAGQGEWTARVVPALAGLLAVLAVLVTTRRLAGRRAGWMAGAVLASSIGYFLSSQFVTLDMVLTAFLTGALCAFLLAQDARATAADHRRFMLVAWALCALAVLTKGLIGVALPMLAIAAYVVMARDPGLLRRLEIVRGVLVLAVITVPWFALVAARNDGFAEFFFIHEHWQRYTQTVHRRTGPLFYFVPLAIVYLLPWLPAIATAIAGRWRSSLSSARGTFSPARFGWCWAAAIFVFFSVSSSKLPAYIMPAIGGVAIAAGIALSRRPARAIRITAWTLIVLGAVVAVAAVAAADVINVEMVEEAYEGNNWWLVAAGAILAAAGGIAGFCLRRGRRLAAMAAIVLGTLAACQVGAVLAWRIDTYFSAARLLERVTAGARPFRPDLPFYSVDIFDHTVLFYLGRTTTLVKEKSELEWGIAKAPQHYIEDVATFAERWRRGGDAYAIMRPSTYEFLQATGLPMHYVDSDGRRVVVTRN